jgi:hypothetical protein
MIPGSPLWFVHSEIRTEHVETQRSQNLGHEQVLTTFASYGAVSPHRQVEIMKGLAVPRVHSGELGDIAQRLTEIAREAGAPGGS